jgi:hypothetical protein
VFNFNKNHSGLSDDRYVLLSQGIEACTVGKVVPFWVKTFKAKNSGWE